MKKAYSQQIKDLMQAYITHISKVKFLYAFRKAFFTFIIEENIQGGFIRARLILYNLERVLSKLDI
jgi:hypothetical protein